MPRDYRFRDYSASLPSITICTPTYGRTRLLPNIIESYLRQDYPGEKRMYILNDRPDQIIHCDVPGVTIINTEKQLFLGEKRQLLLDMCTTDLACSWDDDDCYLHNRLSRGIGLLSPDFHAVNESRIFVWDDSEMMKVSNPMSPMVTMIYDVAYAKKVGGYDTLQINEDVSLTRKMGSAVYQWPDDGTMPSAIYQNGRRDAIQHRMTNFGVTCGKPEKERAWMVKKVDAQIANGEEPTGHITIKPKWSKDWLVLCKETWDEVLKDRAAK